MRVRELLDAMPDGISVTVFDTTSLSHRVIESNVRNLSGNLLRMPMRKYYWRGNELVIHI